MLGARTQRWLIQYCTCKPENLSSDLHQPGKKLGKVVYTYNLSVQEGKTGVPALAGQQHV